MIPLVFTFCFLPISTEPEARPVEQIEGPRDLWMASRWYGLSIVPKDKRLIWWAVPYTENWTVNDPVKVAYRFGWVKQEASGRSPAIISPCGNWPDIPEHRRSIYEAKQLKLELEHLKNASSRDWGFPDWRELSIYFWQNHQQEFADYAYSRWLDTKSDSLIPRENGADQALRSMAYRYWYWQVFYKKCDCKIALLYLSRLQVQDKPSGRVEISPALLNRLSQSMRPSIAKPGSVEAAIDVLTEANYYDFWDINGSEWYWDIGMIPILASHFNDDRLTRSTITKYFLNQDGDVVTVGQTCQYIVWHLLGGEIPMEKLSTENAINAYRDLKKTISAVGEAAWCLDHLDKKLEPSDTYNHAIFCILRFRYPETLAIKLEDGTLRGFCETWNTFEAILSSDLPRERKERCTSKLFSANIDTQLIALRVLEDNNHADFLQYFSFLLREARSEKATSDMVSKIIQDLSFSIMNVDDEQLWMEFIELILKFSYLEKNDCAYYALTSLHYLHGYDSPAWQRLPLKALLRMLQEERIIPTETRGNEDLIFSMCKYYNKISVGNLAAIHLGWVFDEEVPFNPKRTPQEWAAIREHMRKLAEERLKQISAGVAK